MRLVKPHLTQFAFDWTMNANLIFSPFLAISSILSCKQSSRRVRRKGDVGFYRPRKPLGATRVQATGNSSKSLTNVVQVKYFHSKWFGTALGRVISKYFVIALKAAYKQSKNKTKFSPIDNSKWKLRWDWRRDERIECESGNFSNGFDKNF